jgi:hypothetical protein
MTSIKPLIELQSLIKQVKNMDLPKYNKEKIIKTIEFEMSLIEYEIIKELGTIAYKEMLENGVE